MVFDPYCFSFNIFVGWMLFYQFLVTEHFIVFFLAFNKLYQ